MLCSAVRSCRRLVKPLAAAISLIVAAEVVMAQQYFLQPGDTVRLSVIGLPELSLEVTVEADGHLRLPQIGRVRAEDLTIDDLQDVVAAAASGQVFRVRAPDNTANLLTITGDEIFVSVVAYRPVTLAGDVQAPGAIAFRPGLTLRAALASVGGASRFPAGRETLGSLGELGRLRANLAMATLERARLLAENWRIQTELGMAAVDTPPTAETLGIDPIIAASIIQDQVNLLNIEKEELNNQKRLNSSSRDQVAARLRILEKQEQNQEVVYSDDEEEVERVRKLQSNGIVPIQRLLEIRRAQALSASRLLDTQNNIERINQELTRIEFDDLRLETQRRRQLTIDLDRNRAAVMQSELRIEALREELDMSGLTTFVSAEATSYRMTCVVYRHSGDRIASAPIRLDEVLKPGDVVQIVLAHEDSLGRLARTNEPREQDAPEDCAAALD